MCRSCCLHVVMDGCVCGTVHTAVKVWIEFVEVQWRFTRHIRSIYHCHCNACSGEQWCCGNLRLRHLIQGLSLSKPMTPPRALMITVVFYALDTSKGDNSLERAFIMEMVVNRKLLCEIGEARSLLTLMQ